MLSRKNENSSGQSLPQEWIQEIEDLLNSTYQEQISVKNLKFKIIGKTYPNEIFLSVSLLEKTKTSILPINLMLSCDINTSDPLKNILDMMVDSIGAIFDKILDSDDWNDYQVNWQKETVTNIDLYYKISREDIELSIQADEIIKNKNN